MTTRSPTSPQLTNFFKTKKHTPFPPLYYSIPYMELKLHFPLHLPLNQLRKHFLLGPIYEKFDYISNLPSLIILSLQTCDSKPLIPVPRPPKPSEMCQGSALVSVRDDKYWESLDKRLMPECGQQAIVAIESPCLVPVVSILSTKESGRSKRWITCITRDSATRPCHTPVSG